jgi:hypothetical protein
MEWRKVVVCVRGLLIDKQGTDYSGSLYPYLWIVRDLRYISCCDNCCAAAILLLLLYAYRALRYMR